MREQSITHDSFNYNNVMLKYGFMYHTRVNDIWVELSKLINVAVLIIEKN